jgi:hypothetical protein
MLFMCLALREARRGDDALASFGGSLAASTRSASSKPTTALQEYPMRHRHFCVLPRAALLVAIAASLVLPPLGTAAQTLAPHQQLARDIYQELIEINTVTATGDTAAAAQAMANRLRAAGLPSADVQVFIPAARKGNLVARLRGTGARRPIMLLAHLDVVEALREDWTTDPFKLVEKDGYFYARGAGDDKVHGRSLRRQPDPLPAGGLQARPRLDRRSRDRRGDGRRASGWASTGCCSISAARSTPSSRSTRAAASG